MKQQTKGVVLALRVPEHLEKRLRSLSLSTDRSMAFFVTKAIELCIGDLEKTFRSERNAMAQLHKSYGQGKQHGQ